MSFDFDKVENAEKYAHSLARGGRCVLSVSLTYTEEHGKRVTLSKNLADRLNIGDSVFIGVSVSAREIVISGVQHENFKSYNVGKALKIYNAGLIGGIVSCFGLEPYFKEHTSVTFRNVKIYDEERVAIITVPELSEISV